MVYLYILRIEDMKKRKVRQIIAVVATVIAVPLLAFTGKGTQVDMDRAEARSAYQLINKVRANPDAYARALDIPRGLHTTRRALAWNDTLARVAEAKAYDMARRGYFSHVDPDGRGINYYVARSGYHLQPEWLERKRNNNFESIYMSDDWGDAPLRVVSGEEAVSELITDADVPSQGHRKHLLGLDEWNASLVDIGVGIARVNKSDEHKVYVCVVIAKHDW